jgi:GntR family transcriptional regulator
MLSALSIEVNYMTYMNLDEPLLQSDPMEDEASRRIAEAPLGESLTSSPLYREVKTRLTRGLSTGEWKPGEAIPSESRLAERFAVSIGTVRKAIDELVAERILLRQQGRGTFVATHDEDRTLFYFFHIVGKDGSRELPTTDLLSFRKARANATEAERLHVEVGAPVFRIQNVLKLAGRPVLVDEISVAHARFSDLDENIFGARDGTIYGLYQARYGITVTRISERISAAHLAARTARLLDITGDTPALVIKRVAYTYNDTPVEYRVSSVNSERHEYLSDLWRPSTGSRQNA